MCKKPLTGGVSTSLLFSVFEAWYVSEHRDAKKLNPEWIQVVTQLTY